MITITYTITSGQLPITVLLKDEGVTIATNIHPNYGQYTFEYIPEGEYVIEFYGSGGILCGSETINPCCGCYEGYTPVGDLCVGYEEQSPIYSPSTFVVAKKLPDAAYSIYGAIIFDSGWNYNGTGTYENIFPITNTYWNNTPFPSGAGVMNRTSVWASTTYNNQDIGFSFCIDIAIAKTYYIGIGCNELAKIKLNGTIILQQNRPAIKAMFGTADNEIISKYWFIYPINLPEGRNIIEVIATNEYLAGAIGVQIYNATKYDLLTATNANPLGSKILFSSEELEGEPLKYEYSPSGGYHGYRCASGFALDTCDGTPKCIRRLEIGCGEEPPVILPTTTTTSTTKSIVDCLDGLVIETLYLHSFDDMAKLPTGYVHPCPSALREHGCNRAYFEVFGNGVYMAPSRLNNEYEYYGPVSPNSGYFTERDYHNIPPTGNGWGSGWDGKSRYEVTTITKEQAEAIAAAGGSGTNISISFIYAGELNPHDDINWLRISAPNGDVIYNSCVIGNDVFTFDICNYTPEECATSVGELLYNEEAASCTFGTTSVYYGNTSDFMRTGKLYIDANCTLAPAGYYSNGDIYRYWDGNNFYPDINTCNEQIQTVFIHVPNI